MQNRPETGPMKFDKDWSGVFIRGDNAGYYADCLLQIKQKLDPRRHDILSVAALESLIQILTREFGEHLNLPNQELKEFKECLKISE